MADFTRSEYVTYLELCEKLHIEHEFGTGDWFYEHTPAMVVSKTGVAYVKCWNIEWRYIEKDLGQWWFWLPDLGDWREMLEKEECAAVSIWPEGGGYVAAAWVGPIADGTTHPRRSVEGDWARSPEEAMARLWMMLKEDERSVKVGVGGEEGGGETKKRRKRG